MSNRVVIWLPCGLGDIIFCQKYAAIFTAKNLEVVWPVVDEFRWISAHMHHNFVPLSIFKLKASDEIFDLYSAYTRNPQLGIMYSKYRINNLEFNDWQKYFEFKRNYKKEKVLYENVLGLGENEVFDLLNLTYGTPPNTAQVKLPVKPVNKVVYLQLIPGFTLFDWCLVFERAKNIYTVDSSINFILEKISINKLFVFRRPGGSWSDIDQIFKKDYTKLN